MAAPAWALIAAPARAANFLSPIGPVALSQRAHLIEVTMLTLIAVLPVLIGVPLIFWRYRRGNGTAAYTPEWKSNRVLEWVMWGVPLAIVAVLGTMLWNETHRWAPERALGPAPIEIEAVGLNWKWLFLYPDGRAASLGELVLPAGRPVTLKLTSDTVMQSFMIPSLAGQLYAMPGMVTRLNIEADRPAITKGRNMQYNGNGFAGEGFSVRVLDPARYQSWIASAKSSKIILDERLYDRLARPGSLSQARALIGEGGKDSQAMRLEDTKLFAAIVARYHAGTPVMPSIQPGAPAYHADGAPQ